MHEDVFAFSGRLGGPLAVRLEDARGGRAGDVHGEAVVGSDDPDFSRDGPHSQVGFVEGPVDLFGPRASVAAAIDGVKDDSRSLVREFLGKVRVGHGRALRVGPHVVADQAADGDALDFERP